MGDISWDRIGPWWMVVLKQKFGLVNDVCFYVCGWLRRVDQIRLWVTYRFWLWAHNHVCHFLSFRVVSLLGNHFTYLRNGIVYNSGARQTTPHNKKQTNHTPKSQETSHITHEVRCFDISKFGWPGTLWKQPLSHWVFSASTSAEIVSR